MKKVTILALHLGYDGIAKSIVHLANCLCSKYDVEIVCSYKLYDKPSFPVDSRVDIKYLIEVFFVVVTYIFIYPGVFLLFLNAFNKCLKINNKNKTAKYYFKSFLSWIFCIIFFIVSCPFIIIIYSIFPSILAIFDY